MIKKIIIVSIIIIALVGLTILGYWLWQKYATDTYGRLQTEIERIDQDINQYSDQAISALSNKDIVKLKQKARAVTDEMQEGQEKAEELSSLAGEQGLNQKETARWQKLAAKYSAGKAYFLKLIEWADAYAATKQSEMEKFDREGKKLLEKYKQASDEYELAK